MAAERSVGLRLSNDETSRISTVIENHLRFAQLVRGSPGGESGLTRRAIYRFFRDTQEAGIDLVLLGLSDLRGKHPHELTEPTWADALDTARLLFENYFERPTVAVRPPALLNGDDLMAVLRLEPSRLVGRLLESIREAQAEGLVETREAAMAFARTWLQEHALASAPTTDRTE
jgi:hypothetical protein